MVMPTKYNPEIAAIILERYSSGDSIRSITESSDMPSRVTVNTWRTAFPEFGTAYDLALDAHVESLVDEARNIVDTEPDAKHSKVRSEFRMWLVGKLNRAKYGDKLDVTHNVTIDIAPALVQASKRLESLGTLPLIEADAKQINSP